MIYKEAFKQGFLLVSKHLEIPIIMLVLVMIGFYFKKYLLIEIFVDIFELSLITFATAGFFGWAVKFLSNRNVSWKEFFYCGKHFFLRFLLFFIFLCMIIGSVIMLNFLYLNLTRGSEWMQQPLPKIISSTKSTVYVISGSFITIDYWAFIVFTIIVFRDIGILKAIKHSILLFKKYWKEILIFFIYILGLVGVEYALLYKLFPIFLSSKNILLAVLSVYITCVNLAIIISFFINLDRGLDIDKVHHMENLSFINTNDKNLSE